MDTRNRNFLTTVVSSSLEQGNRLVGQKTSLRLQQDIPAVSRVLGADVNMAKSEQAAMQMSPSFLKESQVAGPWKPPQERRQKDH
jgi:hypothetical protein